MFVLQKKTNLFSPVKNMTTKDNDKVVDKQEETTQEETLSKVNNEESGASEVTTSKEGETEDATVTQASKTKKIELTLPAMLKAGVHFGHKKSRWNPKMAPYIFGSRNGIHIIDLEKSLVALKKVREVLEEIAEKNGEVLIVGTKNQAKHLVKEIAEKIKKPYVNERWLGGTLTNFGFIKKRLKFLVNNREALEQGRLNNFTKLERNRLQKKLEKIDERMGGLVNMNRLPDAIIILDINKDKDAVREAKKVGVTVIGLLDTNSDPDVVDYGVPANDDAVSSLRYVLGALTDTFEKKEVK